MVNISTLLTETLIKTLPIVLIIVVCLYFINKYFEQYIRFKSYSKDKYRMNIENDIHYLNNKMTHSDERFKSVNHLLLDGNRNVFSGVSNFFERMSVDSNLEVKEKTVFVLAPLNPEFEDDYKWVQKSFSKHKYICSKGNDIIVNENLLSHIIKEMLLSTFVVANISGRNSNVFYELGIAHALGKDILLITRSEKDITYNMSSAQVVVYKSEEGLSKSIDAWLVSTLEKKISGNITN